ncbi:MAG: AMP-binding protein, partial [Myxococcales bacterium]|nr:AMP-binding protein [Myxococcales bacterium]
MNRSVTAGPATIGAALERIKRVRSRGFVFVDHRINEEALSFADLYSASSRMGRCLLARGLFPGDRVALIIPEAKEFVLAFLGAISAGLIPVPLFPPLTGKLRIHEERTAAILSSCEARCILLPHALLASLPRLAKAACDRGAVALEALASDDPGRDPAPGRQPARPQDPCFLQYTSGSTGDPKGVIVTHHNLVANIEAIAKAVQLRPGREVCVSWLPLCHDMGLIGFVLLPLVLQCRAVFIPTLGFMTRPASWMKTVHLHRGTATFAPNFAFDLAARRAKGIE